MKNWLPSLLALAGSAATIFLPQLQIVVASHPVILSVLSSIAVIISNLLPSPIASKE